MYVYTLMYMEIQHTSLRKVGRKERQPMYMYMYNHVFGAVHDVHVCVIRNSVHIIINIYVHLYIQDILCISYVTAIRYVAAINHEARGRAAPEGE